jgi:hypothetical protein
MNQPDHYEHITSCALLALSNHYTCALESGDIAFQINGHNLLPSSLCNSSNPTPRVPLEFGTIFITQNLYINPLRLRGNHVWTHGELHIKLSFNFGDVEFGMDGKFRGSGEEVIDWAKDFRTRLGAWAAKRSRLRSGRERLGRRGWRLRYRLLRVWESGD